MLSYRLKMALFRPWVPCIIVYIFAQFRPYLLSFAPSDITGKGVWQKGYKTVHCPGAKEKMWTKCPLVPENKKEQNQFEELNGRVNDVSGLVERTDTGGDRGNNGDSEGNDKLKKSYLVVVMYLKRHLDASTLKDLPGTIISFKQGTIKSRKACIEISMCRHPKYVTCL